MTARVSQAPLLVLGADEGNSEISQFALLVLSQTASTAQIAQFPVLLLGRRHGRRTIGITD